MMVSYSSLAIAVVLQPAEGAAVYDDTRPCLTLGRHMIFRGRS